MNTILTQARAGDQDAQRFLHYVHIENGEPVLASMPAPPAAPEPIAPQKTGAGQHAPAR